MDEPSERPERDADDTSESAAQDRRELIKTLGKAAALPLLITTFVATGAKDAAAAS